MSQRVRLVPMLSTKRCLQLSVRIWRFVVIAVTLRIDENGLASWLGGKDAATGV